MKTLFEYLHYAKQTADQYKDIKSPYIRNPERDELFDYKKSKIRGQIIYPPDVEQLAQYFLNTKIFGSKVERIFNNVIKWTWNNNKSIRLTIYNEYCLIEKLIKSPKNYLGENIWILKNAVQAGIADKDDIITYDDDESIKKKIKKILYSIAKEKQNESWNKKINIFNYIKKCKEILDKKITLIWFKNSGIIKKITDQHYILYYSFDYGHTGLINSSPISFQLNIELIIDDYNIINCIVTNITSSNTSSTDWKIDPSSLNAVFSPEQNIDEIVNAIVQIVERY